MGNSIGERNCKDKEDGINVRLWQAVAAPAAIRCSFINIAD